MRRIASVGTLQLALGLMAGAPAAAGRPGQDAWEGADLPITAVPRWRDDPFCCEWNGPDGAPSFPDHRAIYRLGPPR
ncbi:MAG: hypothetical protein IT306_00750 [Chloroflexi bacterium]|nr:hypothetical protein [Chloroflexota bacterium]